MVFGVQLFNSDIQRNGSVQAAEENIRTSESELISELVNICMFDQMYQNKSAGKARLWTFSLF